MKPWEISLILFIGSLVITIAFWMLGLPFFFVFLFLPLAPFFFKEKMVRRCRYADGKPQAARTSAPSMRLPSVLCVTRLKRLNSDIGIRIPKTSVVGTRGNVRFE